MHPTQPHLTSSQDNFSDTNLSIPLYPHNIQPTPSNTMCYRHWTCTFPLNILYTNLTMFRHILLYTHTGLPQTQWSLWSLYLHTYLYRHICWYHPPENNNQFPPPNTLLLQIYSILHHIWSHSDYRTPHYYFQHKPHWFQNHWYNNNSVSQIHYLWSMAHFYSIHTLYHAGHLHSSPNILSHCSDMRYNFSPQLSRNIWFHYILSVHMHPHCSHNIPCWQTNMMMHLLTNMSRPGTENVPGSSMHYTNTFHLNTHNHIHTMNKTLHLLADTSPHHICNYSPSTWHTKSPFLRMLMSDS